MPDRIHVLHVLPEMSQGGVETVLANVIAHSDPVRFDHHILVLSNDNSFEAAFKDLPVTIHYETKMGWKEKIKLAKSIDLVHVCHNRPAITMGALAYLTNKPMVMGVHSTISDQDKISLKYRLYREHIGPILAKHAAKGIICCTSKAADMITKLKWKTSHMRLIPNGIDTNVFIPSKNPAVRDELGVPHDAIVVGISARYCNMKDIPNFIQAAKRVKEQNPDQPIYFLLSGKKMTAENRELVDALKQAGIYDRSRLLGVRTDMPDVYASMDVLVSSSAHSEALSMALLEGSACGCLCVATDCGDHRKLMSETGGVCVPIRDADALATGINQMIRLPDYEKAQKRTHARQTIIMQYGVRRMARDYHRVFEDIVASSHLQPSDKQMAAGHGRA